MSKRGHYYKLVESQQQRVPSNNLDDLNDPADCLPNEGSTFESHNLPQLTIDHENRMHNQSRDTKETGENDISIWKLLRLSKPEWIYTTLGVIGSGIVGLSAPVYGVLFGELMGILDPSLIQEEAHRLNDRFALVLLCQLKTVITMLN